MLDKPRPGGLSLQLKPKNARTTAGSGDELVTIQSGFALGLAMLALAVTPGPGVFATTSRALSSGMRPALVVIAGIVTGDVIYLLLAVFGLSMIANVLGELFVVVRILGGLYLIWLGVRLWLKNPTDPSSIAQARTSARSDYVSGLVTTLSNPKVILFYGGFLPTFLDLSKLSALDVVAVLGIVTAVLTSVMVSYAFAATRVRGLVTTRREARRLDRVAGSAMIATGAIVMLRR